MAFSLDYARPRAGYAAAVPGADPPADRLAETTLALVDIPSESRNEAAAAEWVEDAVPTGRFTLAYRGADTLYYATERRPGRALVLLAGHLDTVPAQGNVPGRIEAGAADSEQPQSQAARSRSSSSASQHPACVSTRRARLPPSPR